MKHQSFLLFIITYFTLSNACMELSLGQNIPEDIIFYIVLLTKSRYNCSLINKKFHALITPSTILSKYPQCLTKKEHICFMVKSAKKNDLPSIKLGLKTASICNYNWLKTVFHFIPKEGQIYTDFKKFQDSLQAIPNLECTESLLPTVIDIYKGTPCYIEQYKKTLTTIDKTTRNLLSPLHVAIDLNQETVALLLLTQDPTLLNKRPSCPHELCMDTPLKIAIQKNYVSICNLFFSYPKIELNSTVNGLNLLEWTCNHGKKDTLACVIKNLKKKLPDTYSTFFTPQALEFAIKKDNGLLFLEAIDYKLIGNNQPLHIAAKYFNKKLIESICNHKNTDINGRGDFQNTPLILAVQENNYHLIKLLLNKNADPAQKNSFNKTALDYTYSTAAKELLNEHINKATSS